MNVYCKQARKFLKESTRKEFETAVYESNLTQIQEDAVRLHILKDKTIVAISLELSCSERSINKALQGAYLKICKYLLEKNSCVFDALNMQSDNHFKLDN